MATDKHPLQQPILIIRMHIRFRASHTEILHLDHQGVEQLVKKFESFTALDSENSHVRPSLREALDQGIRRVIVDLSDVIVLNSMALAELIDWHNMIGSHDGALVLCSPTGRVSQTLAVTKLDTVFHLTDDLQKARDKLRALRPI